MSTTNLPHYADREHPRHPTPLAGNEAIKASVEIESIEIHGILANISRFGACVTISQELALMALHAPFSPCGPRWAPKPSR